MRVAIYGRPVNTNQVELAESVFNVLSENGCSCLVHEPYFHFLKTNLKHLKQHEVFLTHEDLKDRADFLFSIGGDGTLLDTIFLVKDAGIPVVGVNAGRLGFLSGITRDTLSQAVTSLKQGHYSLDARSLIRL